MLRFLTSLSFLYALTILLLLFYGYLYYRDFSRSGYHRRRFPYIFLFIGLACFSFLYFNMNASLGLKTFSNLEHHFIRHDGFAVSKSITIGRSDSANTPGASYNRFVIDKHDQQITVASPYAEDPLYSSASGSFQLLSASFPTQGHALSFRCDSLQVQLRAIADSGMEITINGKPGFTLTKPVRKGTSAWNYFKDQEQFINSNWYTNDLLFNCLKNIYVVRDKVAARSLVEGGQLAYFISGRFFRFGTALRYDGKVLGLNDLAFKQKLANDCTIAWGIGFLDNNRNQFLVKNGTNDSFALINRYPVEYPLSEENNNDWTRHAINKFLAADSKDILNLPPVFNEGFLFSSFNGDSAIGFAPVLLSYQKGDGNEPLQLKIQSIAAGRLAAKATDNKLILPARATQVAWLFSITDTFNWKVGGLHLSSRTWQAVIFGSLLLFFLLVFISAWLRPAFRLSWVWQLLTSITLVLLTTRYFLYWRYKSFPPFEGMDLPSQQQLDSFSNFGIIVACTVLLAVIFGWATLTYAYRMVGKKVAGLFNRSFHRTEHLDAHREDHRWEKVIAKIPLVHNWPPKLVFFGSWLVLLLSAGGLAALNHFDPATCRHVAIGLVIIYFGFVYVSYRHSPLSASASRSWWSLHTGRSADIIINNPVKVLLSISLLAVFVFVDIGFAIVFLNFLLFNEAFLCINYAIAGLSAGSRKNAALFGGFGALYLIAFIINLLYAPYIFKFLLDLPQLIYLAGYGIFAVLIAYNLVRVVMKTGYRWKPLAGLAISIVLFAAAFLFFPKEKILEKAAITKYRIDVMTLPADKAIERAYEDGKTYEPVIRAAQNQWFINTFIYEKNNPGVGSAGFHLLPHAPQNKGAKYNAQATDLVASRFFLAEHGKWSVLLYVLLLLLPTVLLASFYKLYPDFTNRVNTNYPTITAGFSVLNYLLITALLVILAATGRYIFFGQDLPFGSILSKQSVVFPCLLIIGVVMLFRRIPLERYPNRRKLIPGAILFGGLALLLFFVKPQFNKNKEFTVTDLAKNMDGFIESRLQPVFDYFDSSLHTRRLSIARKDKLFTDSIRKMAAEGFLADAGSFFNKEIEAYTHSGFGRHLDQANLLYLDLNSGVPQLAVNDNYFRIEAPPHLQQFWKGNVFGDTTVYNVSLWNVKNGNSINKRLTGEANLSLDPDWGLSYRFRNSENQHEGFYLVNHGMSSLRVRDDNAAHLVGTNDSIAIINPSRLVITHADGKDEKILTVEPDAFMKNYYVNGSRYYLYPMSNRFTWVRNFAESVSADYTAAGQTRRNAYVSFDYEVMDSLSFKIRKMMSSDTAYKKGAEYGICIADGNGRVIAMADFIKGMNRPDPNDKAAFTRAILGDNGFISQSLLRKQIGNINLLRLNPGPGSTFKPIVFSAIASQLNIDWDQFSSEGFTEPQHYFGGEKVAEYDFEKNNGRITKVAEYLRYSDNYYHSNVLLLGSYPKQPLQQLLAGHFAANNPDAGMHWPYFSYNGKQYWLNGFQNWPDYHDGKANFGSDSSFTSIGLLDNFGIYTAAANKSFDRFPTAYDSMLFRNASHKSGFILPEYGLFDQQGTSLDHHIPYDLFAGSFRGHVKGSSQVMVPPVKMLDAYGKLVTQSRNYSLTLNPYAGAPEFQPFYVDENIAYNAYLSLIRENVFLGMREALFQGTAARLGTMLKDGAPYYYFAKTGTTGDNEVKTKSKLFVVVISAKDIADPGFNFRNNKFYTIYFTLQNGPAKQNEEFQAAIINYLQRTKGFNKYMKSTESTISRETLAVARQ